MADLVLTRCKLLHWLVLSVIVGSAERCLGSATTCPGDNERLIAIAAKVDAIERKLDSLTTGQSKQSLLISIDHKLDGIGAKLDALTQEGRSVSPETPGGNEGIQDKTKEIETPSGEVEAASEDQEDFPYQHSVTVISVERSPGSVANTFTVKFTKNSEDIFCGYKAESGIAIYLPMAVEDAQGIWTMNFTQAPGENVLFVVGDKVDEEGWSFTSTRHVTYLELDNSELSNSYQELQPLPELHVNPPRAAIYEPGRDFNVTAFVQLGDGTPHQPEFIYKSLSAINMSDGKFNKHMSYTQMFHDLSDESSPNKTSAVLTSSTTVSGYLFFTMGDQFEGPLVLSVQIDRIIEVHPSNQSTTLPPNFLDIAAVSMGRSMHGNDLQQCVVGQQCDGSYYVVGDAILEVGVVKLLPDGGREAVPSVVQPHPLNPDTYRFVHWTFQAEPDSGEEYGITTFECWAIDVSRARKVTKQVGVQVILEDGLDEENSNVTVQDDHMHPQIKHVTLNCAVYGRPLPHVTFSSGTSSVFSLSMDSYDPDSVVMTGKTTAVATKNLTIDLDYQRLHGFRLYEDDEMPNCGLYSVSRGEYIEHAFQIPDIGLPTDL